MYVKELEREWLMSPKYLPCLEREREREREKKLKEGDDFEVFLFFFYILDEVGMDHGLGFGLFFFLFSFFCLGLESFGVVRLD